MPADALPLKPARRGLAARPWWPKLKPVLELAFGLLVLALLLKLARHVDWAGGFAAMLALPASTLLPAAALAAASHALYCSYDLIGRHQTGHGLSRRTVVAIGFVSYATNLNLGSLVGGVALRYKLYSRFGLAIDVITRVLAFSLLTNWLGYLCVGGLVLLLNAPPLPASWIPANSLPAIGAAALALVAAYLALCALATRRDWQAFGHRLQLPSGRIAVLQLLMSCLSWMTIAAIVYVLLQQRVDYPSVLGTLLLAAIAGVITHLPAGLGVLEAVFITLLGQRVPQADLVAALLAYRVLYYLLPLAGAGGVALALNRRPAPESP